MLADDACNSLLYDMHDCTLFRLQKILQDHSCSLKCYEIITHY